MSWSGYVKLLICRDFLIQSPLWFTKNGLKTIKISSERKFTGWKCLDDPRGQGRMTWLLMGGKSNSINHSLQIRYVKEHLLKQIPCYSSRGPHQLSLLSVKLRLQFTQTQQTLDNSRLEKLAWSVESQFLPQRSGGRVIIWYKQHVWPLSTHSMQIHSPTPFEGYSVLPFGVTCSRKDSSTHLPVLFCWANVRPLLDKLNYVN